MGAPEIRRLVASASGPSYRPPVRDPRQADAVQLEDPTTLPLDADTYQPPSMLDDPQSQARPVPPKPPKEADPFADLDAADAADLSERDRPSSRTFLDDENDSRDADWESASEDQRGWNQFTAAIDQHRRNREASLPEIPAVAPEDRSATRKPSLGSPSGTPQPQAARPAAPNLPPALKPKVNRPPVPGAKPRVTPQQAVATVRSRRLDRHDTTDEEVEEATRANRKADKAAPPTRKPTPAGPTNAQKLDAQRAHSDARAEYEQGLKDDEAARTEAAMSGQDEPQLPVREQPMLPFEHGGPQNKQEMMIDAPTSARELAKPNSQRLLEIINPRDKTTGKPTSGISDEDKLSAHFGGIDPKDRVRKMMEVIEQHNKNELRAPDVRYAEDGEGLDPSPRVDPAKSFNTAERAPHALPLRPQAPFDHRQTTTMVSPGLAPQDIILPDAGTMQLLAKEIEAGGQRRQNALLHLAQSAQIDTAQYTQENAAIVGEDVWKWMQSSAAKGMEPGRTRSGERTMVPGEGAKAATEAYRLKSSQKALVQQFPASVDRIFGKDKPRSVSVNGKAAPNPAYGTMTRAELVALTEELNITRNAGAYETSRQANRNRGEMQNWRNPEKRRLLIQQSLQDATSPEEQAQILESYGESDRAAQVRADATDAAAVSEAGAARKANDPLNLHGRVMNQIDDHLAEGDVASAENVWIRLNTTPDATGQVDQNKARADFTEHYIRTHGAQAIASPHVQNKLSDLYAKIQQRWTLAARTETNVEGFLNGAMALGIPSDVAQDYWDRKAPPPQ